MDNQTQKKPVTAVRRGITGAIAGEVVMIVIFILVAASGAQVSFAYALIYLLFGPIYGFGFTFANWRLVAEKTKRGAVEEVSNNVIGFFEGDRPITRVLRP